MRNLERLSLVERVFYYTEQNEMVVLKHFKMLTTMCFNPKIFVNNKFSTKMHIHLSHTSLYKYVDDFQHRISLVQII